MNHRELCEKLGYCEIGTMQLSETMVGDRVRIYGFEGGCRMQGRLASMGLYRGVRCEVIQNQPGNGVVLSVYNARIVICDKMAMKIKVMKNGAGQDVQSETAAVMPAGPTVDLTCHSQKDCSCNIVCLRQMQVNQSGTIRSVKAAGELGRRIRDMGLVPNTPITVVGRAPLKDPVAIRLRDFTLSLRNNEADYITVDLAGGECR